MRILLRLLTLLSLSFGVVGIASAQPKLEKLWLTEGLNIPESVLFYADEKSSYLFVSQIEGDPNVADGKGAIAKMALTGALTDAAWVTGLNAPKGMAVFDGKLYVADINEVVIINIKKKSIEKKIPVTGAQFLNDLAIDTQGTVYISDTLANKIFRVKNGTAELYLDKVESANGLRLLGSNLIVGAGTQLLLFDRDKNRLTLASGFAKAIDGIELVGQKGFIVSCWPGIIYFVSTSGQLELLLDSQQSKINTADIGFDPATKTVYVPNFSKNSVTAYKLVMN
jgi:DNA-binding beta-propeller fold protein YncE